MISIFDRPLQLYRRVKSRPPPVPLTEDEQDAAMAAKAASETRVKIAFMRYMAGTGVFEDFEESRLAFGDITVRVPHFLSIWDTHFARRPRIPSLFGNSSAPNRRLQSWPTLRLCSSESR
jgi:hypothetical protein